jgi:hypothetical protein
LIVDERHKKVCEYVYMNGSHSILILWRTDNKYDLVEVCNSPITGHQIIIQSMDLYLSEPTYSFMEVERAFNLCVRDIKETLDNSN